MAQLPQSKPSARAMRPGSRVGLVVSSFHAELTGAMQDSAIAELLASGCRAEDLVVVPVPGSFELPIVARRLALSGRVESVICLGLVLRGETEHDRWVAQGAVQGLVQASLETDVPMHLGMLTCATLEQARARALPAAQGGRHDKGREVARAAIGTLLALDLLGRNGR